MAVWRETANIKGDPGPPGPPGTGAPYRQQFPESATWTITHGLGKRVVPTLLLDDFPGEPVMGEVSFPDLNTTVVTWPAAVAGWAEM